MHIVHMINTIHVPLISLRFTDCSPMELWHQSANGFSFLPDVSLLEDADEYPSCGDGIIGSVVLKDTTLNIATVAYYNGNATGSRACFVCNNGSGYELNAATNVRVCQTNALWSGSPIVCGMLQSKMHEAIIIVTCVFMSGVLLNAAN